MILTKEVSFNFVFEDLEIKPIITQDDLNKQLFIVPTNRKRRSLKKELLARIQTQAICNSHIETIGTFSDKIISSSNHKSELGKQAAMVLLEQCINSFTPKYFKKNTPYGTRELIYNVINEYKTWGIFPDELKEQLNSLPSEYEKKKLQDIIQIFEEYQKKLSALQFKETGDVYNEIILFEQDLFNDVFRKYFPLVESVLIKGFDEFTTPEQKLINKISGVPWVHVFLHFDYYKSNPSIFHHLDECFDQFEKMNFKELPADSLEKFVLPYGDKYIFRDKLKQRLFNSYYNGSFNRKKEKETAYRDKINLIIGKTRSEEIKFIAKEIKQLIASGVQPHEICLSFRVIQNYSETIKDVFAEYKIPYNLTDRYSLESSDPIIALYTFLEVAENDFYYETLFKVLNNPYLNLYFNRKDENGSDRRIYFSKTLIDVIKDLRLFGSYKSIITRIEEEKKISPDKIQELDVALEGVNKIYGFLKPFFGLQKLEDFKENLIQLSIKLNIPLRLINTNLKPEYDYKNELRVKALSVFYEVVEEVFDVLKLEHNYDDTVKFSTKYYLDVLRTAISSTLFNIKEKTTSQVLVTNLDEIRGLEYSYLFIGGLMEKDFPVKYSPQIFFYADYAEKRSKKYLYRERFHFYQALCSFNLKGKLYCSFSLHEDKEELTESHFIHEFLEKFEISNGLLNSEKKDKLKLYNALAEKYNKKLYSEAELLIAAGEEWTVKNNINLLQKKFDEPAFNKLLKSFQSLNKFKDAEEINITNPDLLEVLQGIKERSFSISQLEMYADCAFKYFCRHILYIKEVAELSEEMESYELGILIHQILYMFYEEVKKENLDVRRDSDFPKCVDIMFQVAEEVVEENLFSMPQSFLEKEKLFGINGKKEDSILYKFLLVEKEEKDFEAFSFEAGFGKLKYQENEPLISELKAGDVNLNGKIDRIDINDNDKTFRVIDYKTGSSIPSPKDILEGKKLQLPIYMYAAGEIIKKIKKEEYHPASMCIFTINFSKELKLKKVGARDLKDLSSVIDGSLAFVQQHVNNIINGNFNTKDEMNRSCDYCEYSKICRIQEKEFKISEGDEAPNP